jgi:hypothetical protein
MRPTWPIRGEKRVLSIIGQQQSKTSRTGKRVIACLVEGNRIRETVRLAGVAKDTGTILLVDPRRSPVHGTAKTGRSGGAGDSAYFHERRGAPIPVNANVYAPVQASDKCFFTETRKPRSRRGALLYVLQFRPHSPKRQSLRVTPAMEAGMSDHVWSLEEIDDLLPAKQPVI